MPKFFSRKDFIFKADILVLILCLGGLYQSAEKAGLPVALKVQNGHIRIVTVKKAAGRVVVDKGDRLIALNGHPVFSPDDVEFLLDRLAIGQSVQVTLQRERRFIKTSFVLQRENSTFYLFILSLVGFVFLGLGVFVLKKRPPGDTVALIFHFLSLTVALHITTTFGRYTVPPFPLGYFLRLIFLLASSLTPVLFLHFSFIFPFKKGWRFRKYFKGLYLMALGFFAYLSLLFVHAAQEQSLEVFHRFMQVYNIGRWLFALSFVFAVGNFIHSYIKAREEAQRRKLRWVILGLAIGPLAFVLFWQIPQTFQMAPLLPEEWMLLITALTPLTFAISIVRYHLLDIDFIFNRSTVYFLVIGLLLIIYAAIVGIAALSVQFLTVKISLLVSAFAAVVLSVLFEPLRRAVQKFVDKRFFRVRYDYRLAQRAFTQRMERCVDVASLIAFIVQQVQGLMHPQKVEFYFKNTNGGWQKSDASQKEGALVDESFLRRLQSLEQQTLARVLAVGRFVEPGVAFAPIDASFTKRKEMVLVLPVRLQNAQIAGFLVLGKKKSDALYSREDIDLLKTVVQQTAFTFDRIRLQQDLLLQHAEAKRLDELNRMKSYFVSAVSHDLQTPLTSIRMFAELLQKDPDLPLSERREYLEIIQGESERLSRLIRNVLDFSRLERGVKTYDMKPIDVRAVVQSVWRSMKYQLKQHHFETVLKVPDHEITIEADGDALAEALENLITNAIKYSPEEKYLRLSLQATSSTVVLEVQDRGVGIAPDKREKIFEMYFRDDAARTQVKGGVGLGLSLVKHIVQAHGGRIEVHGEPGKGSTFVVILPRKQKNSHRGQSPKPLRPGHQKDWVDLQRAGVERSKGKEK